jgi:protein TonB
MFEQTFLEKRGRTGRPWMVLVSSALQLVLIGVAVLLPLVSPEALPLARFSDILFGPLPPPGDSTPERALAEPRKTVDEVPRMFTAEGLMEPQVMPARAAEIVDDLEMPALATGSAGGTGVPGGIGLPGSPVHPVIGNALGSRWLAEAPPTPARVAAAVEPAKRIVVGGLVRAPKPLDTPPPVYPRLAVQMRVSGTVRLEAVIGTDGRVRNIRLIQGHPLLAPAAVEAVKRWVYTPTLLNGDPVEVVMQVDVNFSLGR